MPAPPRCARASCTAVSIALMLSSSPSVRASPPASVSAPAPIEPAPIEVAVCNVRVEQLPAASLAGGGYQLWRSDGVVMPVPSDGLARFEIAEPVVVRLAGAAYQGELALAPEDCGETVVHVLQALPKPATLLFQTGSVPLDDLVVSCVRGCELRLRPAVGFPALPLPEGELEFVVALEFKARGHRSEVAAYKLYPGENLIRVSLQRL